MTDAEVLRSRAWPRTPILMLLAAGVALVFAVAIGNPTVLNQLALATMLGLGGLVYVAFRPYVGFLILAGSAFFLVAVAATEQHYINAFDAFLPPVMGASVLGRARYDARVRQSIEAGPGHDAIRQATRTFSSAAIMYLVLAALSLINILRNFGTEAGVEISYYVIRTAEIYLIFPLALWWIRSERHLRQTYWVVIAFVMSFAVVNTIQVLGMGTPRAGIVWVASRPMWPVEGPNEAAASLVVVWAMLMVEHTLRPRWYNLVIFGVILIMEVWTQSRSGLLALITFNALIMRRVPTRYLVLAAILGAITLPLAPTSWWERMTKTVELQRGSVELFSWLMRVFAYITAFKVLIANWHWAIGVGFLGFRFVSDKYNTLHYKIGQCENWWLETWVGIGIIGLFVAALWFVRFWKLGSVVKRVAVPGTFGYYLADMHVPLVISLGVVNLTGASFIGLTGISQVAIWSAMVVRGGHIYARDSQTA